MLSKRLSAEQLRRVTEIHRVNLAAFNENILRGYDYKDRLYYEEGAGTQKSRKHQDLMQAKWDHLEA